MVNVNFNSGTDEMEIRTTKDNEKTTILLGNKAFKVPHHWFWDQFSASWEPQTLKFFEKYLIPETDFLDIGGWVGPTALIGTALGARTVKVVEPNPTNFFHLLLTQGANGLFSEWFLVNACLSKKRASAIIGPLQGIASASSASNIRDQNQDGAKVISLKLSDLLLKDEKYSLIKVDIEGAEELIVDELQLFSNHHAAVWFSLHPPFFSDKKRFATSFLRLQEHFYFIDGDGRLLDQDRLKEMILTDERLPEWGTKWGNFFEIGLLPKRAFDIEGNRLKPQTFFQ